ncbi:hypothetical protein BKA63DRAFT_508001 [Paraphoma chrysanthemicola]|nr:hypothetical protein BKA63DRAFT_508001 [Paraphoma chrysanthemicola]
MPARRWAHLCALNGALHTTLGNSLNGALDATLGDALDDALDTSLRNALNGALHATLRNTRERGHFDGWLVGLVGLMEEC